MKSSLLLSSVSLFVLGGVIFSQVGMAEPTAVNYSLWPKPSPLKTKVQELINHDKLEEAKILLEQSNPLPEDCKILYNEFLFKELYDATSSQMLSYKVKRGDSIFVIAKRLKSSPDYLIEINHLMNPAKLKIGQELKYRPLEFTVTIDIKEKIVLLKDKERVLKSYPLLALRTNGTGVIQTKVKSEVGISSGYEVRSTGELFPSLNKRIDLAQGGVIGGTKNNTAPVEGFYLSPEDCNELSLFIIPGNDVEIIH